MTIFFRLPLLYFSICLLLLSSLPLSVAHAEVVYETAPPAKKITKKKKRHNKKYWRAQKRSFLKKTKKKPDNIVFGLYITFGILILLPVLVMTGTLLVALGFPSLIAYIVGASLIGLGNLGVILAGALTGATATYNTQALYFSVWVLFGLNLAALITFLLLYTLAFSGASLLIFLTIGVAVIALIFLVWAALITRAKRNFKQNSRLEEE